MKSEMAATLAKIQPRAFESNNEPNQMDVASVHEAPASAEPTFTEIDDRTDQSTAQ